MRGEYVLPCYPRGKSMSAHTCQGGQTSKKTSLLSSLLNGWQDKCTCKIFFSRLAIQYPVTTNIRAVSVRSETDQCTSVLISRKPAPGDVKGNAKNIKYGAVRP